MLSARPHWKGYRTTEISFSSSSSTWLLIDTSSEKVVGTYNESSHWPVGRHSWSIPPGVCGPQGGKRELLLSRWVVRIIYLKIYLVSFQLKLAAVPPLSLAAVKGPAFLSPLSVMEYLTARMSWMKGTAGWWSSQHRSSTGRCCLQWRGRRVVELFRRR